MNVIPFKQPIIISLPSEKRRNKMLVLLPMVAFLVLLMSATAKVPTKIKCGTIMFPTQVDSSQIILEEEITAAPCINLQEPNARSYVNTYAATAVSEMKRFGIPASISLAQGLIESRAGTSKLAVNNNNHFGLKCFSKHCKKGHCTNFTDDSHKDFFKKFPTAWESWRAHSKLLSSARYTKLKKYGRDYRAWANGLQSVGYATDRTYASKLIGIIERYDLHRYDR